MEEKKKGNAKGSAGKKSKPAGNDAQESVEEVAVESTQRMQRKNL